MTSSYTANITRTHSQLISFHSKVTSEFSSISYYSL
jgi:hypothetical protein